MIIVSFLASHSYLMDEILITLKARRSRNFNLPTRCWSDACDGEARKVKVKTYLVSLEEANYHAMMNVTAALEHGDPSSAVVSGKCTKCKKRGKFALDMLKAELRMGHLVCMFNSTEVSIDNLPINRRELEGKHS